jgi:hypothetical protein
VDLREVTDGDRLAEFMARTDVVGMALTPELPTDKPTQLRQLLDGERPHLSRKHRARDFGVTPR